MVNKMQCFVFIFENTKKKEMKRLLSFKKKTEYQLCVFHENILEIEYPASIVRAV